MSGLFQSKVEYFNGKEWIEIKNYKKGDKVLTFNRLTNKISLMTPIQHIKKRANTLEVYKLESRSVNVLLEKDTKLYMKRKDCSSANSDDSSGETRENVIRDCYVYKNILKHNDEIFSTFQWNTNTSSYLDEHTLKIMMISLMLGKIEDVNCELTLDRTMTRMFDKLVSNAKLKVERKRTEENITYYYRLPRSVEVFTCNPLAYNELELSYMTSVIIDCFTRSKSGLVNIEIEDNRIRDFIQLIFSTKYQCVIKGNKVRVNLNRKYMRLSAEVKKVRLSGWLYNFRIANDYIVCRCDGVILLLSSY